MMAATQDIYEKFLHLGCTQQIIVLFIIFIVKKSTTTLFMTKTKLLIVNYNW